VPPTAVRLSN
jgi:hypothetical protein